LTEPFVVNSDMTLTPWMLDYTSQNSFMIHSDKVLTIIDPVNLILKKYEKLIE